MRLVEKLSWTARVEAVPGAPLGILGKKYFGGTTIYREGTPSVHRGWRRPPPGGQGLPPSRGEVRPHSARCLIGLSCDCFAFFR